MVCINVTKFRGDESSAAKSAAASLDEQIHDIRQAVQNHITHSHWSIGTDVQNPTEMQLITEWDTEGDDSVAKIHALEGSMLGAGDASSFRVALNKSAFTGRGAGTANIYECVQSFFAASTVTPQFKRQIEQDFLKFDGIYSRDGVRGSTEAVFGWTLDKRDHEDIHGEKAISFFVMRGWDTMASFHTSLQTANYKESIPILYGWNAPFQMWHVKIA